MCFIETDGREKLWQRYRCCGCLNRRKPFTLRPSKFGAGICCTFCCFFTYLYIYLSIYLSIYLYIYIWVLESESSCGPLLPGKLPVVSVASTQTAGPTPTATPTESTVSLDSMRTKDGLLQRGLRGRRRVFELRFGSFCSMFVPMWHTYDDNYVYIYIHIHMLTAMKNNQIEEKGRFW